MTSSRGPRHILFLSDQDVLRAGNQVLFKTIEGYLAAGFHVTFVTNQKDDSNIATTRELFGTEASAIEVHRFPITVHARRRRLVGGGWLKRVRMVRSVLNGKTATAPFPPPAEEVVPFAANLGTRLPLLDRFTSYLFDRYAFRAAMRIGAARPVDLVYGYEAVATPIARKLATRLGVPLCTRFQGSFLKHALDDGTAVQLYPRLLKGTAVEADLYIMSNDGTKGDEVLTRLGHPPERVLFLVDGVRKDIYRPDIDKAAVWSEYGIPAGESTRIILTLSKLGPWKRHDRIIGAMPAILRQVPDAYLVIAHRGELRPQLERYARELGVAHRVIFTGPIPHTQVYRVLNACDVYVNCNDHSNLSHPVMEAMVCGKPVVSIDDGSLDGIVTHGENGILVSLPRIREEMPTQVAALLKDDARRATMGHAARRFAERNLYSWEERMKVEVERVESLLGQRAAA